MAVKMERLLYYSAVRARDMPVTQCQTILHFAVAIDGGAGGSDSRNSPRCAKLQSNHHQQQTSTLVLYGPVDKYCLRIVVNYLAPCGLRGCKSRTSPFPGRMS